MSNVHTGAPDAGTESSSHDDPTPEPPGRPERLERPHVEAMDALLGHAFPVLDDGFVRVVDYMGGDASVVQAARVSYGTGTRRVHQDRGLIRYLLRHRHTTPFEMCELKLHVRVPMDAWRQWIRHRSASVNEYSTRYSIAIDAAQATPTGAWRRQAEGNRQGSEGFLDEADGAALTAQERRLHAEARRVYDERLAKGVAREQARKDLPLSTYTEAYWKVDLHNLLHFLRLRMDAHAQLEIRAYAEAIGREIVAHWCPITWEAFLEYQMESIGFSGREARILAHLTAGRADAALAEAEDAGWLTRGKSGLKRHRERAELEAKLETLGISPPW